MIEAHKRSSHMEHRKEGRYIKSVVYGGLDGIITTFAIVAGVTGASLTSGIILILGFANLLADGLSMAVGDYLSSKSEQDYLRSESKKEEKELEKHRDEEKNEMSVLYQEKGLSADDAIKVVNILSKYQRPWVDAKLGEEIGLYPSKRSPIRNGVATFLSFVFFGFIPLIAYLLIKNGVDSNAFLVASILTAGTLFFLGAMKHKVTGKNWIKAGSEMLLVGGIAAIVAYFIGFLLSGLVYL